MLNLFRRSRKWHEVHWIDGPRDIYMALSFVVAPDAHGRPTVERLPAGNEHGAVAVDSDTIIREVEAAVVEYNRHNLCELRVAAIRYRASPPVTPADHRAAARKLLNLLWMV